MHYVRKGLNQAGQVSEVLGFRLDKRQRKKVKVSVRKKQLRIAVMLLQKGHYAF